MRFPHRKREPDEYGNSPGNGISPMPMSAEPLASMEEADRDVNTVDQSADSPDVVERDDDPYVFDDIGVGLGEELARFEFEGHSFFR